MNNDVSPADVQLVLQGQADTHGCKRFLNRSFIHVHRRHTGSGSRWKNLDRISRSHDTAGYLTRIPAVVLVGTDDILYGKAQRAS